MFLTSYIVSHQAVRIDILETFVGKDRNGVYYIIFDFLTTKEYAHSRQIEWNFPTKEDRDDALNQINEYFSDDEPFSLIPEED